MLLDDRALLSVDIDDAERRCRFGEIAELAAEKSLRCTRAGVSQRLSDVLAIWNRLGQTIRSAFQLRHRFRDHRFHRRAVGDDVMQLQDCVAPLALRAFDHLQTHERGATQIEPLRLVYDADTLQLR